MAGIDRPLASKGSVVATIGTFDGVHLGHRRLIEETRRQAAALALPCVAVTFDRHPMAIVRPAAAPRLLTGLDHKLELLRECGVDVVVLEFDARLAAQSAEQFVESVLVAQLGVRALVVGSSFHFGHRHRGDVTLLQSMGARRGFTVTPVELVTDDAERTVISSTLIRQLIGEARLDEARRLLGRDHEVRGEAADARAGLVAVPAELLVPPAGDYRVSWSTAGVSGTGVARVGERGGGATMIELAPDVTAEGNAAPDRLAGDGRIAVRFIAAIGRGTEPGEAPSTSRARRYR
jgi:riboflavin kinase/FMN adenylyltransferase